MTDGRATTAEPRQADVFTYEVLRSLMNAIPLEMAEVLKRTSYHPIFNEVLDFSTALLTRDGEMIAQAGGVAVHLAAPAPPPNTTFSTPSGNPPSSNRRARA